MRSKIEGATWEEWLGAKIQAKREMHGYPIWEKAELDKVVASVIGGMSDLFLTQGSLVDIGYDDPLFEVHLRNLVHRTGRTVSMAGFAVDRHESCDAYHVSPMGINYN